ncbi:MAG: MFS transporter [Spirochaetes bacterium]|nr:MFS transporter [Spirochaetota bacterium]
MTDMKKRAYQFIILFGIISLLGDIIYEGARSVNAQYLKELGASALWVGIIAGLGEFIGYAIRLVSGYVSDRTRAYWLFTFVGYGLLVSVPLLALTGLWQVAALLMVAERLGKALRSPSKDTILSQVTTQVGRGLGFGLHEAMDQIGAIAGPLIFTAIFAYVVDYNLGYTILWIPFVLLMAVLIVARYLVPHPEKFETAKPADTQPDTLTKTFWLYTAFSGFAIIGFANFPVIAYHLKSQNIMADMSIPLLYAIAMGVDAVFAIVIGKLYDSKGLRVLMIIPLASAIVPVLAFSFNWIAVTIGTVLWGLVMAIHETIMRAAIADLTSLKKRGTGYGIFNTAYGLCMFIGASVMGWLYEINIQYIIIFSVATELIAVILFMYIIKAVKSK